MAGRIDKWLFAKISAVLVVVPLVSAFELRAVSHPLYISVTEINHNPKDKILEVSCKIFTNDFEAVLEKTAGAKVDLSSVKDKAASDKLIAGYVERHLRLKVDGKPVLLHFVGSENEDDGTWSYFQVNDLPTVKRIDVVNELLYDGFPQQINIMHVTVGGQRQSTRVDCPAANASFQF
ncbi:MAG TPA: DUF6702 family protein [Puia sp.]|nr:DUF6702 family protein [Puia sp.]